MRKSKPVLMVQVEASRSDAADQDILEVDGRHELVVRGSAASAALALETSKEDAVVDVCCLAGAVGGKQTVSQWRRTGRPWKSCVRPRETETVSSASFVVILLDLNSGRTLRIVRVRERGQSVRLRDRRPEGVLRKTRIARAVGEELGRFRPNAYRRHYYCYSSPRPGVGFCILLPQPE